MESTKVYSFLEEKKDYLFPNPAFSELEVSELLLQAPDSFELSLDIMPFKNPKTVQLISLFCGLIGIDRFYLRDIKKGILKYFTFGGLFIWHIKDIRTAKERCREYNCRKLIEAINDPSVVNSMIDEQQKLKDAGEKAKVAAQVGKVAYSGLKDIRDSFSPGGGKI